MALVADVLHDAASQAQKSDPPTRCPAAGVPDAIEEGQSFGSIWPVRAQGQLALELSPPALLKASIYLAIILFFGILRVKALTRL